MKTKFTEIYEGKLLAENKDWYCEIDGKDRKLALYVEIMDTNDWEEKETDYPFVFSIQIMAAKPHKSFAENDEPSNRLSLIEDVIGYMGGVPVDHTFLNIDKINQNLMEKLSVKDATIKTQKHDFGTIAAQKGRGAEFSYPMFKTLEAAEGFTKKLVEAYSSPIMGMLIGFTLDKPINMVGETGWSVIERQVKGK